ncbi:hypothetical protein RND81_14G029000 [Saponaria officinalis]|uniref:Uncharacterized protein n=1 Tax=Saponaria officinalis TaxID=3572 RepID=A0AAW1GKS4_SAPOF
MNNKNNDDNSPKRREEQKIVMARRALRSLIAALIANISLPITIILLFGSGRRYHGLHKPIWFPPLWMIHICTVCSSFFMGLAAWLVWADGGFHINSDALPIYVAQISLNVTWYPLVLVMGFARLGLFFWVVNFVAIFACYLNFTKVNHIAGCIVKPCVFWAGFLLVVTLKICLL